MLTPLPFKGLKLYIKEECLGRVITNHYSDGDQKFVLFLYGVTF